jgi:hypothetical protein
MPIHEPVKMVNERSGCRLRPQTRGVVVFLTVFAFWVSVSSAGLQAQSATSSSAVAITVPLTVSSNPHYFKDASGHPVALNGSQTWNTFQDYGTDGTLQTLDFNAFIRFLTGHGQNFTLLWTVEMAKFCALSTTEGTPPDYTVSPLAWRRTGPGNATDGGLKFDLTKFDQGFFDRLRQRTKALGDAGIYAGIYPFTGEYLLKYRCSDDGYPFTGANNVNGIDDSYQGGLAGISSLTMTAPNEITKFQDAYVEKMIDTLNDLPNVLWIVSEEGPSNSMWWNQHQIAHIREYESKKPHRHPIGIGAQMESPDSALYNSAADWVAPQVRVSPLWSCGDGKPACKVNINDSDHTYWEIWKETAQQNRNWAWENFTNGNQALFMDPYLVYYPRQNRNECHGPVKGICSGPDARWDNLRDNLGYILRYSRKLNLEQVTGRGGCTSSRCGSLCSTGFCLAQTPSAGAEYLVYAPEGGTFTVNLSAMPNSRKLAVEWFNPSTGALTTVAPVPAGSSAESFTAPFGGDAVLYLVDTQGHATSASR